ncbi:MAG: 1-deoxy-D-xylulose-5-phosphate synthase [Spirochaetes bacterium]|nr:1-deoxy-D-xylulose-5-phosphate synthase [Spirochaetota bacterium]
MDANGSLLDRIDGPENLVGLSYDELARLAGEIRERIISVVSRNGGHLASNLGVVELAIALHRVFQSPADTIIWDVGHQCYAHKLLTGRRDAFPTLRTAGGISGFPKPSESPHDLVETGHASTAISYGLGLAMGREMRGEKGRVVAVVGDGALSGGLALAGLNHAGHLGKNLVIVLNDNAMSIGRNVGAISAYLGRLTTSRLYQAFRRRFDQTVSSLPVIGSELTRYVTRLKKAIKAIFFTETLFADLGFEYAGPIDGHDIPALEQVLSNARRLDRPVVVHVTTRKGRGYRLAEDNPTRFHGISPFSIVDGKVEESERLSYTEVFADVVTRIAREDTRVVGVTAAMTEGTGLAKMRREFPERVFDVGIAEDHAVTFAAGLALSGLRPVVAVYSTFLQRAVDQVVHDVAIPRRPVVFAVDRAGLVSGDGETHQGVFDLAMLRPVPGLAVVAPAGAVEMETAFRWAFASDGPTVIRYPKAVCTPECADLAAPFESGRGVFARFHQSEVLIVAVGAMLLEGLRAAEQLNRRGIAADVYNLRFVRPLDEEYLASVLSLYGTVVTAEEGTLRGGVGEAVARTAAERGIDLSLRCLGTPDRFLAQATRDELLARCGLDAASIAHAAEDLLCGSRPHNLRGPSALTAGEPRG